MKKTSIWLQALMPDTIGITGLWKLRQPLDDEWQMGFHRYTRNGKETRTWKAFRPAEKHLTIHGIEGEDRVITKIECSLSALVFGHNGRPFTSERELREAILQLERYIDSVATNFGEQPYLHRLDFAVQISTDVRGLLRAYERVKLNGGKLQPVSYPDESLRWKFGDIALQIYDKTAQMKGKGFHSLGTGSILRIELQIRSKKALTKLFGKDTLLRDITLETCYRVFRNFVVAKLPGALTFNLKSGAMRRANLLPYVVASCEEAGIRIGEESMVAFALRMLVPSAARKFRKDVGAVRLEKIQFRPDEVFPKRLRDLRGVAITEDGNIELATIND